MELPNLETTCQTLIKSNSIMTQLELQLDTEEFDMALDVVEPSKIMPNHMQHPSS
jgi:hypothetical protein